MKVLHLDTNHQLLIEQFAELGFENHEDYTSTKEQVEEKIHLYDGIIIRSRFTIDQQFLDKATNLKFIGRVGAGLENIDVEHAKFKKVFLASAPEGNRNAVGEHTLGMLLSLMNNMCKANRQVKKERGNAKPTVVWNWMAKPWESLAMVIWARPSPKNYVVLM